LEGRLFLGQGFDELPEKFRNTIHTVTMLDVIEHIEDDTSFVRRVREAYPALRSLIATVPARQEIWSNYDIHYGHFRRYDLKQLRALGTSAGFRTTVSSYMFRAPYVAARLLSAMQIKRGTAFRSPTALPLHCALARLLHAERILPPGIRGSSAVVRWEA
jgi:hypothetical protein